jgi:hypothetical protein
MGAGPAETSDLKHTHKHQGRNHAFCSIVRGQNAVMDTPAAGEDSALVLPGAWIAVPDPCLTISPAAAIEWQGVSVKQNYT